MCAVDTRQQKNSLFTPPPTPPPPLPLSIPSIFVLRTSRLPGYWREPQVNKKIGEGREGRESGWGWVVGYGGGGYPDGATDVLAAAALLCRQTGSSELGLPALLPSPSLCSAPLLSILLLRLLFGSFCSLLHFWGHFSHVLYSSDELLSSLCRHGGDEGAQKEERHPSTGWCKFKTLFEQRSAMLNRPWGGEWKSSSSMDVNV